jgi:hypothetical protein
MSQSKRGSAMETVTNTGIGLLTSAIANAIVFPYFGFHVSGKQNIEITLAYTVISIVRSYWIRRMWNWIGSRGV